jgi:hypothetical protein
MLEEGGASSLLVASDKTNGANFAGVLVTPYTVLVVLNAINTGGWVVLVTALNLLGGNLLDHILVSLEHTSSKRRNNLLEGTSPLVTLGNTVGKHGLGEVVEVSTDKLKGKEDGNRQKVEKIMDGGTSKGTLELISRSHLSHGDDSVGNGGTNVGSHDEVDARPDRDGLGSNKGDNNRGGSGRTLNQGGGKLTNHKGGNGVGLITQQSTGGAPSKDLGGVSEEFQTEEDEVEEEEGSAGTHEDHAPAFGIVDTACLGYLSPGGITNLINGLVGEVGISKVGGAGGAILTGAGFRVSDRLDWFFC